MKIVNFQGIECYVIKDRYTYNLRPSLILRSFKDNSLVRIATYNVPEIKLDEDEVVIDNHPRNKGLLEILINNDIIELTEKSVFVEVEYGIYPVCRLKI